MWCLSSDYCNSEVTKSQVPNLWVSRGQAPSTYDTNTCVLCSCHRSCFDDSLGHSVLVYLILLTSDTLPFSRATQSIPSAYDTFFADGCIDYHMTLSQLRLVYFGRAVELLDGSRRCRNLFTETEPLCHSSEALDRAPLVRRGRKAHGTRNVSPPFSPFSHPAQHFC